MIEVFLTGGKWSRRTERSQGRSGPFRECFFPRSRPITGGKWRKSDNLALRGRRGEGNAEKRILSENIWEMRLLALTQGRQSGLGAELGSTKPSLKPQADFPSPTLPMTPDSCLSDGIGAPGLIQPKGRAGGGSGPRFQGKAAALGF